MNSWPVIPLATYLPKNGPYLSFRQYWSLFLILNIILYSVLIKIRDGLVSFQECSKSIYSAHNPENYLDASFCACSPYSHLTTLILGSTYLYQFSNVKSNVQRFMGRSWDDSMLGCCLGSRRLWFPFPPHVLDSHPTLWRCLLVTGGVSLRKMSSWTWHDELGAIVSPSGNENHKEYFRQFRSLA